MSSETKYIVLDTWAGRRYYAVEVVGETPKKLRVRILTPGGVMRPRRRYLNCGDTLLVPKQEVVDTPKGDQIRPLFQTNRCFCPDSADQSNQAKHGS